MKHFFTLALASFLSLSMIAQTPTDKAVPGKLVHPTQAMAPEMESRDVFWTNDISNCADWTFGNGADEIGSPWAGIDLNFECTTLGPAGYFNGFQGGAGDLTPAPPINSTSGGNALMVDSDLYGASEQYDANWVENSWVQTVAPIDCSVNPYVAISFQTRYACYDNGVSDGSEKCFVEISRDGENWPGLTQSYVTTWEEEGIVYYGVDSVPVQCRYEVFPNSASGFLSDNPSIVDLDITEAAGGQSTVWIRFRWVGTWGYAWEIDDINLFDVEQNDLRVEDYVSYTNYLETGIYENGAWPESQMLDTLNAALSVYNFGYDAQQSVQLDIDVAGYSATSDVVPTLPNAELDTLVAAYTVSGLGLKTVNYQVSSDVADNMPENNVATQSFEVTEFSYGRDNGELFDVYGGEFEYACMPYYDIHNDVTIYGIDVAIQPGGTEGSPIEAWIIDADDDVNVDPVDSLFLFPFQMEKLATSGETYLNPDVSWSGTGDVVWYTFKFEEPYDATAGQWLGAAFEYYGGAELTIAESSVNIRSAAIFGPGGADNVYAWRRASDMPMVRLNLDPNLVATEPGVNRVAELEGNLEVFESIPNPASSEATIRFVLSQPQDATLEVRDMQGRIVLTKNYGTLGAGEHNERLDVSSWAAGTYTYTMVVGETRQTRKLMVD